MQPSQSQLALGATALFLVGERTPTVLIAAIAFVVFSFIAEISWSPSQQQRFWLAFAVAGATYVVFLVSALTDEATAERIVMIATLAGCLVLHARLPFANYRTTTA